MSKKPKFNPEVNRIKLDPEQAVLTCNCYTNGDNYNWGGNQNYIDQPASNYCVAGATRMGIGLTGWDGNMSGTYTRNVGSS